MKLTERTAQIDRAIGARIKAARELAGISQERLGRVLGITFQQIQKYETGRNRVSASALTLIAEAVGQPVSALLPPEDRAAGDAVSALSGEIGTGLAALDEAAERLGEARQALRHAGARAALAMPDDERGKQAMAGTTRHSVGAAPIPPLQSNGHAHA